jgi:hypothetical protein
MPHFTHPKKGANMSVAKAEGVVSYSKSIKSNGLTLFFLYSSCIPQGSTSFIKF